MVKIGERRDIYGGELPRSTSKDLTITKRPKNRDLNKKAGRKIS